MTFVLVHGGGFAGSCWDPVLPYLDAPVRAVDLPGRGSRPADLATVRVSDWVKAVVEEIGAERVVLVGHSLAGITLPGVAAAAPERIRRLVFVSCAVPPEGGCVLDTLDPDMRAHSESNRQQAASKLSDELATALFCNDMTDEQRRFTLDHMLPEAMNPISEPISLAGLRGGIPCTYIKLLRDAIITPERQDRIIEKIGDAEVVEIDAGHMAMISAPQKLAEALNALHAR